MTATKAAIDCGTNSTRLLIVDDEHRAVVRDLRHTRLGAGVDATGRLDEAAIARTLDTLQTYRETMNELGVDRLRAVATSAARDAENAADLLVPAFDVLGVELEILSGNQEAELSFAGATHELPPGRYAVVDIGGGSTEIAIGRKGSPLELAVSLDAGCVRLTEQFLAADPPLAEQVKNAAEHVEALLAASLVPTDDDGDLTVVGVAGTTSAAAAYCLGLREYDYDRIHLSRLSLEMAERTLREMSRKSTAQREAEDGIPPGRSDVFVGGLVVLVTVLRHLETTDCLVSEQDILDGLANSLA